MLSRYEQFSSIISSIYRSIQKIEREEMVQYGFKGAYAQYLAAISRHPAGVTATQLCEICDKDKAAISRVIAEMEEKGLVERSGGPENRYRARIRLTDAGYDAARFVSRRAQEAVAAAGMEAEALPVFYAALERVASNLHTISREGIPPQNERQEK